MSDTVDITGLDHAAVLAALYNRARPQGLGMLNYTPEDMTVDEARGLLDQFTYFDYVKGRVMKVSLRPEADSIDPRLYDRDNGHGALAEVVAKVRQEVTT